MALYGKNVKSNKMNDTSIDIDFYRDLYIDLTQMSNDELINHWNLLGKNEGRFITFRDLLAHYETDADGIKEFDFQFYITYYEDLYKKVKTYYQAIHHYLKYGKKELRFTSVNTLLQSIDFDEKSYLKANPDIQFLIEEGRFKDVFEHLKTGGFYEIKKGIRKFHCDFEPYHETLYLKHFPEVKTAIEKGMYNSGFNHFLTSGYLDIKMNRRIWMKAVEKNTLEVSASNSNIKQDLSIIASQNTVVELNEKIKKLQNNIDNLTQKNIVYKGIIDNYKSYLITNETYLAKRKNDLFMKVEVFFEKNKLYFNENPENNIQDILETIKNVNKFPKIISTKLLDSFDAKAYLEANKDVALAIQNKKISSALQHLIMYGWNEINTGKRRLYNSVEYFNEKEYLEVRQDIREAIKNKQFNYALEHYIIYAKNEKKQNTNIEKALFKILKGDVKPDHSKRTVLICAHIVGDRLFGSERSLLDMIEGAASHMNVILSAPKMNDHYFNEIRKFTTKVYVFPYGWWKNTIPVDETVVNKFEKIIIDNNINIVHTNTIMLREPMIAAKNLRTAGVIHVRELIEGDQALIDYIGLNSDQIINEVNHISDYLIGNSDITEKTYRIGNEPHYRLYNTLDITKYYEKRSNDGQIHIGLISSNIPKKGIYDFVEVAEKCQNNTKLIFNLIGPETSHTEEIKKMNLPNIRLLGYKNTPQEALEGLDIVLSLSNFTESFGRTVLEAMASKKPVIAYRWGAVQELIEEGKSGFLVDYRDIDAVVNRLNLLSESPSLIDKFGKIGYKNAKEQFDISKYKINLVNIYEDIIKKEQRKHINIAYFLWHFPVPSETFVLNELRILVRQNYYVKVYCKQSPYKDFHPDFPIMWERVNSPEHFAELLVADNIDVVHSHFVYPTVTDMVWPACQIANKKFTFIAHAQDIFRYGNDEKNKIDQISNSENCLKVFVPARFHFNYLLQRGVPEDKMIINPNGIDSDLYIDGLKINHAARQHKSICAIHRFTEKKGLIHLINAAPLLDPDITINIYGYGDLEDEYRELIKSKNIKNVNIKSGVKSRKEMLDVFSKHDLFACPSVRAKDGDMDGIPTVLMEAMASGIPVLTTDISGIPDLVTDELTGIITTASADNIAKDIKRFYALPNSKVQAISENGINKIRDNFNTRYLIDNLLRVWEEKTIDLIIVSWNNLPELKEVCRRLLKYTSLPFRLIICDNDSKNDVIAYLKELDKHKNVTVIFNDTNALVGPGTNLALSVGKSDYAIYVCGKEGFTFDYGWEKTLVKYMEQNPNVGQAGTLGYSPTYLCGKDYPAGVAEFKNFRNKEFALENPDRVFKHVQGGFFIMRRKMYEEIGGFSYKVPHNYTDVEYSYYIESCGWELGNVPEFLALFNKTRPGLFNRMDETMHAMHPPMLDDLPKIDRVIQQKVKLCNLCEWEGKSFTLDAKGFKTCPNCSSKESDRTLFRYLAESNFTHRRLPAIGIDLNKSIMGFWKKQFQGRVLSYEDVCSEINTLKKIQNSDAKTYVIYLKYPTLVNDKELLPLLTDFYRLLHFEGELIIQLNDNCKDIESFNKIVESSGFVKKMYVRYNSNVCQYDWHNLVVYKKDNKGGQK